MKVQGLIDLLNSLDAHSRGLQIIVVIDDDAHAIDGMSFSGYGKLVPGFEDVIQLECVTIAVRPLPTSAQARA